MVDCPSLIGEVMSNDEELKKLWEEQDQEEYEGQLKAQRASSKLTDEQQAKRIPDQVVMKSNPEEESSTMTEGLRWVASMLVDNTNKLSELYQSAMTLEEKTVTLDSETLAGIVSQLGTYSRDIQSRLGRLEYDQTISMQRANTIVGKTNFKAPVNWGTTILTNENVDATIAEVRAIKAVPLTRDFWPQPVEHIESQEIQVSPAPNTPSIWKRFLYFLGFSVPEVTDRYPRATS